MAVFSSITAGIVTAIAAVAGTALSVVSSIQQGQQQAAWQRYNAQLAEQAANQTRAEAAEEERRYRQRSELILSQRRAIMGASGVAIDQGSPLLAAGQQAADLELGALDIRYSGENRARGYQTEADYDRAQASQLQQQGLLHAGASLISGVSNFGSLLSSRPPTMLNSPFRVSYPTGPTHP